MQPEIVLVIPDGLLAADTSGVHVSEGSPVDMNPPLSPAKASFFPVTTDPDDLN